MVRYLLQDPIQLSLRMTQNPMQACMTGKTKIIRNTKKSHIVYR